MDRREMWAALAVAGVALSLIAFIIVTFSRPVGQDEPGAAPPTGSQGAPGHVEEPGAGGASGHTGQPQPPAARPPATTSPLTTEHPPGSAGGVDRQVLTDFLDDCDNHVSEWREGQIDYPGALNVNVDSPSTYVATVNISPDAAAAPPPRLIPGGSPARRPVALQCAVAARLTTTGDYLDVDDDDWMLRTFTPSGVLDWSWTVTGKKLGAQDVRLELQPAVTIDEGGDFDVSDSPTNSASFVTPVKVTGSWWQETSKVWSEAWPVVVLIGTAVGAAMVAVIRWWRNNVRAALTEGQQGGDPPAGGPPPDPPGSGDGPPAGTPPGS